MRVLGILTGITHVSGADYLRAINERVQARVPAARTEAMAKNCRCVLACVDCDTFVARLEAGDPDACARYLVDDGVGRLVAAGAEVLVIASNTGHVCCELVARVYPHLPVLHIADAVGAACRARGIGRVGLLGTSHTMAEGSWIRERLREHGVSVVCPADARARAECFRLICDEPRARAPAGARAFFVAQARAPRASRGGGRARRGRVRARRRRRRAPPRRGCVVLGCTELELPAAGRLPRRRAAQLGAAPRRGGRARAPRGRRRRLRARRRERRGESRGRRREADAAPAPRSSERHGTVGPAHAGATPGKHTAPFVRVMEFLCTTRHRHQPGARGRRNPPPRLLVDARPLHFLSRRKTGRTTGDQNAGAMDRGGGDWDGPPEMSPHAGRDRGRDWETGRQR